MRLGVFRILDELFRRGIPMNLAKVGPEGIDGHEPTENGARSENILEPHRFLVRRLPRGVGLLLEAINRPRPRQDAVNDIHQHGTRKQQGADTNARHGAYQLHLQALELTIVIRTEKVIPAKNGQGQGTADPGVA